MSHGLAVWLGNALQVTEMLCSRHYGVECEHCTELRPCPPTNFRNRQYSELVAYCFQQLHLTPIGLYRTDPVDGFRYVVSACNSGCQACHHAVSHPVRGRVCRHATRHGTLPCAALTSCTCSAECSGAMWGVALAHAQTIISIHSANVLASAAGFVTALNSTMHMTRCRRLSHEVVAFRLHSRASAAQGR